MSAQVLPPQAQADSAVHADRTANTRLSILPWSNVRFGITVPKRLERRSVARNIVKRVVREAARHAAGPLTDAAPTNRIEVVFRLKSSLPEASSAGWARIKTDLRREADQLLAQLRSRLEEPAGGPGIRGRRGVTEELAKSARSSDRESGA